MYQQMPREPRVPEGIEAFSTWFNTTMRLFGAKPWVYVLQGLTFWVLSLITQGAGLARTPALQDAVTLFTRTSPPDWGMFAGAMWAFMMPILGVGLVVGFITTGMYAGLINTVLKQLRGEEVSYQDLFGRFGALLPLWVLGLVVGVMAALGFALCCIPGVLVIGLTFLATPLLIDRQRGIFDSIGESWRVCSRNLWLFLFYGIVIGLISAFGGSLFYGIGAIFTLPLSAIAMTAAYWHVYYGSGEVESPYGSTGAPAYIPPPYAGPMPPPPPPGTTPELPPPPQP